uniref:Uncharacterized protein n=1 Tax=Ananas comosus var. bracteatus TaxID=296719 RepID=A0A6V7QH59_ANACO|nr:unnamed protein product [Ananas comosus var. bracteatus]
MAPTMGLRHAAMAMTGSALGSLTSPLKMFSSAVRSTPEQQARPRSARTTADPWGRHFTRAFRRARGGFASEFNCGRRRWRRDLGTGRKEEAAVRNRTRRGSWWPRG